MLGKSDDIRKETKNKTENEPCYGGFGGRFSYELLRSKNRSAKLARMTSKIASTVFSCIFFGGLGVLAGMMIYQVMQGGGVLRPAVEESKSDAALLGEMNLADSSEQLSVTSDGARMVSVTKEFSERYRIPMGALIEELSPENTCYDAGVREGDIIVMVGTTKVLGAEEIPGLADIYGTEDSVPVRVFRDGEYHDFVVEIE